MAVWADFFLKRKALLISRIFHPDDTESWNPPGLCLKGKQPKARNEKKKQNRSTLMTFNP